MGNLKMFTFLFQQFNIASLFGAFAPKMQSLGCGWYDQFSAASVDTNPIVSSARLSARSSPRPPCPSARTRVPSRAARATKRPNLHRIRITQTLWKRTQLTSKMGVHERGSQRERKTRLGECHGSIVNQP